MFRIVEDAILITIAILTVAAVIFELLYVFENGVVGLADLLLMFIYAEVLEWWLFTLRVMRYL